MCDKNDININKVCFQCSEICHQPIRCDIIKKWRSKCESHSDSETAKWLLDNAKNCPNCNSQIEKSGGCDHMTCSSCKYEFCWLCLKYWLSHEFRSCIQDQQILNNERQSAKVLLEKFNHYWTRFKNHEKSLNAEKLMWKEFCAQSYQLTTKEVTGDQINSILKNMEVLCNCRQTLMFSYPFAYYILKSSYSIIFETYQSNLELSTERLSHHLEEIHKNVYKITDLKSIIFDESYSCDRSLQVLVDHVNKCYDNQFWHFISDN